MLASEPACVVVCRGLDAAGRAGRRVRGARRCRCSSSTLVTADFIARGDRVDGATGWRRRPRSTASCSTCSASASCCSARAASARARPRSTWSCAATGWSPTTSSTSAGRASSCLRLGRRHHPPPHGDPRPRHHQHQGPVRHRGGARGQEDRARRSSCASGTRTTEYDRLGFDERSYDDPRRARCRCCGCRCGPGRNIATIIEVAARNQLLKVQGTTRRASSSDQLNRAIAEAPAADGSTMDAVEYDADRHRHRAVGRRQEHGAARARGHRVLLRRQHPGAARRASWSSTSRTRATATSSRSRSTRASAATSARGATRSRKLRGAGHRLEVMFLDASDEVLLRRFSRDPAPPPAVGRRPDRRHPPRPRGDGRAAPGRGGGRHVEPQHAPAEGDHPGSLRRHRQARGDAGVVRLQARPAARVQPGVRRAVPAEPVLRADADAPRRPRSRGREVRARRPTGSELVRPASSACCASRCRSSRRKASCTSPSASAAPAAATARWPSSRSCAGGSAASGTSWSAIATSSGGCDGQRTIARRRP